MMRGLVARNAVCVSAFLALVSARAEADSVSSTEDKQQCIAASEQGQSERDEGRYRAARKAFFSCARNVCPRVIVDSCTKWLRDLDDSAPSIVLGARDEQGNDLTEVNVTFDGLPLVTVLDGKPIEVDAGEHVVRFERTGSRPVQQKLVLRAGDRARGVTVTLASSSEVAQEVSGETAARNGGSTENEAVLSPRHVTAASLAIGSLVAAGLGIYFIAQSDQDRGTAANLRSGLAPDGLAQKGLAQNACTHDVSAGCQALRDSVDAQHREANTATALFAGAAALAVGAIASWFVWPAPDQSQAPKLAWMAPIPGGVGAGVSGSF